jgi:hypothetical protein
MPTLEIDGLYFDQLNMEKMAQYNVTIREALEMIDGSPKGFRNHSEGAPWILVGATRSGRMLTMPLDPTAEPAIWRPRTAYDSSNKELRRYEKE